MDTESPAPLTQIQRLLYAFIAPAKTFRDISGNTTFWLPLLLAGLAVLLPMIILEARLLPMYRFHPSPVILQSMKAHGMRYEPLSFPSTAFVFLFLWSAIGPVVSCGTGASLLWLSCRSLNAKANYKQLWAVVAYANFPASMAAFTYMLGLIFLERNLLGRMTLVDYFPHASLLAKDVMSEIGLIQLWTVVLLSVGLAIIARISMRQAVGAVVVWQLIGLVITMGEHRLGMNLS